MWSAWEVVGPSVTRESLRGGCSDGSSDVRAGTYAYVSVLVHVHTQKQTHTHTAACASILLMARPPVHPQ